MKKIKKILCGPYVGEFGWEISFFSRYVNNLALFYKDKYEIHVMSYPGRSSLYSDFVQFHEHPAWFCRLKISQNAYIADQWIDDWPKINNGSEYDRNIFDKYLVLKKYCIETFGPFSLMFSPAELFKDKLGKNEFYGTFIPFFKNKNNRQINLAIPLERQLESPILSKNEYLSKFMKYYGDKVMDDAVSIAVLPRMRLGRRPDKNWSEQNYRKLIAGLQDSFKKINIFIIGSPGGCYFSNGEVPPNTLDLINIPDVDRLDVQLAALQRCNFAIGGLSGAMLVCLAAGVSVIEWGWPIHMAETRRLNYLKTPLTYIKANNPSVDVVLNIAKESIHKGIVSNQDIDIVNITKIRIHQSVIHRVLHKLHEMINKIEFSLYVLIKGKDL